MKCNRTDAKRGAHEAIGLGAQWRIFALRNYGVCGGFGDLHILDSDDLARWEEMGVLSLVPSTFSVESRPGHRQFYVECKENFQSGGLFDPEKTEINEHGKKVYALNPKMSLGATYWDGLDLIDVKIDVNEAYRSQKIALSGCYRYVIGLPIGIIINNSNRIPTSLSANVGGSIERDTCSCEKCLGWMESVSFSILISSQTTDNDQKQR
jgi:hypothetical protein